MAIEDRLAQHEHELGGLATQSIPRAPQDGGLGRYRAWRRSTPVAPGFVEGGGVLRYCVIADVVHVQTYGGRLDISARAGEPLRERRLWEIGDQGRPSAPVMLPGLDGSAFCLLSIDPLGVVRYEDGPRTGLIEVSAAYPLG